MAESLSTAPPPVSETRLRRARLLRRGFFTVICLILVAAAFGRLGVHSKTVKAEGGGYRLNVKYDDVTRSGLPGNLSIEIRRTAAGGGATWPDTVDVAMTSAYGDIYDVNGTDPEPESAYTTAKRLVQRFPTPPHGDTMTVTIDARVQPGVQWKRARGRVAIVDGSGNEVVGVPLSTFVLP